MVLLNIIYTKLDPWTICLSVVVYFVLIIKGTA